MAICGLCLIYIYGLIIHVFNFNIACEMCVLHLNYYIKKQIKIIKSVVAPHQIPSLNKNNLEAPRTTMCSRNVLHIQIRVKT